MSKSEIIIVAYAIIVPFLFWRLANDKCSIIEHVVTFCVFLFTPLINKGLQYFFHGNADFKVTISFFLCLIIADSLKNIIEEEKPRIIIAIIVIICWSLFIMK